MKYLKYFWYVCRHKWYVFLECCKYGLIWRGLIHDLSKFLPCEFIPYAQHFYSSQKQKDKEVLSALSDFGCAEVAPFGYFIKDRFDTAWLKHLHKNKHHWQYWILENEKQFNPLPMPVKYIIEMYCDWVGAGKAIHHTKNENAVVIWYEKNKELMLFYDETQEILEKLIYKN